MKMLKDLMQFDALKLNKTIKEKATLEFRLERWTREAKKNEERKVKNQRAAATQTEPASMGQWDRRSEVFANARVQGFFYNVSFFVLNDVSLSYNEPKSKIGKIEISLSSVNERKNELE
ncbi:hypothetical protein CAEBREN_04187 [Caenorhabditis brenneri]|uniref:Uncharacterized protein n=1 Tax=Caenorhabditis brenneri TaxID=135651 RepID=G0PHT4_CAEBE|nr:hypothetical protein CAEBREN_04187 [Caenorhabditis brenneri]